MIIQEDKKINSLYSSNKTRVKKNSVLDEKVKATKINNNNSNASKQSTISNTNQSLFPTIPNPFNYSNCNKGCMNMDSKYQSNQIIIEDNIRIPPINETELIKQRNKIVEDYINDMEHMKKNSKENNIIKEGVDHNDEEDDAFLLAEKKQRKEKLKSNRENRIKYPNCNIDHSSFQSTREQYLPSKLFFHNPTLDNNDQWHYISNNNNDSSYLYSKESTKKSLKYAFDQQNKQRNKTAKNCIKISLGERNCSAYIPKASNRIKSFKPDKPCESKKKKTAYEGNDAKNPYSINWANKMRDKRFNMELEIGLNGYANGLPSIKLSTKKDQFNNVSKRQLKENLDKMKKKNEDSNACLKPEMTKDFNTNTKNFFQMRKEIQEESLDKENDNNDGVTYNSDQTFIQFPLIYKFFQHDH